MSAALSHAKAPPEGPLRLRLFIAGSSPRSERAMVSLRQLAERLGDACDVDIVDVVAEPGKAEQERILATPTLIKESPRPRHRVTGDLSDLERVLTAFGLAGRAG